MKFLEISPFQTFISSNVLRTNIRWIKQTLWSTTVHFLCITEFLRNNSALEKSGGDLSTCQKFLPLDNHQPTASFLNAKLKKWRELKHRSVSSAYFPANSIASWHILDLQLITRIWRFSLTCQWESNGLQEKNVVEIATITIFMPLSCNRFLLVLSLSDMLCKADVLETAMVMNWDADK